MTTLISSGNTNIPVQVIPYTSDMASNMASGSGENTNPDILSYVMGQYILISSPSNMLYLDHIMPRYSTMESKDIGVNYGYSGDIGFEYEPTPLVHRENGTMYILDLGEERPVNSVVIYVEDPVYQSILDTAKVIIKNARGDAVWQSCHFLKRQQLNDVKVVKN